MAYRHCGQYGTRPHSTTLAAAFEAAGIEVGDVITAFDDQEINRQNSLLDLLFGREPGDVVTVTVDRDGEIESFQVTLGERPEITE